MVNKIDYLSTEEITSRLKRFGNIAHDYTNFRPGYPRKLINKIYEYSDLKDNSLLLEIGSGPGTATKQFTLKKHKIHCVEPNLEFILLAKNMPFNSKFIFHNNNFEDWDPVGKKFDLIFSAQAFHWINPNIGYRKLHQLLIDDGALALFWNMYPKSRNIFEDKVLNLYLTMIPNISAINYSKKIVAKRMLDIKNSGYFSNLVVKEFRWEQKFSAMEYIGYLNTFGNFARLDVDIKEKFFEDLQGIIKTHGGYYNKSFISVLYLAKKKSPFNKVK